MSSMRGGPRSVEPVTDAWTPPPADQCWSDPDEVLQVDARNRIVMRRVEWNEQLVDYAVVWTQLDEDGKYVEQVCIDCKHGTVHRHDGVPHSKSPRYHIRTIYSQSDVQESFSTSFDEVYDAYLASLEES